MYPEIQLELTTGLSHDLLADYEAGQLDVVIAKRKIGPNAQRGESSGASLWYGLPPTTTKSKRQAYTPGGDATTLRV
ncbi:hypothetical protein [Pseudomonas fluorescens]|uniref:hypothetical protein n=1 Tax=Pseudomonas fluorescens TaxID=294 RepID=UPI00209CC2AF|nr:hypothetical protein [Pseudomonas fluorescens]